MIKKIFKIFIFCFLLLVLIVNIRAYLEPTYPFPTNYSECLSVTKQTTQVPVCIVRRSNSNIDNYFNKCRNAGGFYMKDTDAPVFGGVVETCIKEFRKEILPEQKLQVEN